MNKEIHAMLDMMLRPAFSVLDEKIKKVNRPARNLGLEEDMELKSLLLTGQEELDALESGCLYLQLALPGGAQGAAVTRMEEALIFVMDQENGELQALSLAAKELRSPLNALLAISGTLLPNALPGDDPKTRELLARVSRELYRLQRIVGNMSDAEGSSIMGCQEMRNISQVFDDIFEKATAYLALSGVQLTFQGLNQDLFGLMDLDQMERAVLNVLSNAAKFSTQIHAHLIHQGTALRLIIQDNGPGIGQDILGSLFQRYLRQAGIEDSRFGLGLGMVMIRAAAASHGGTVLVDSPKGVGTRVTLTLQLRQDASTKVHSPRSNMLGGRDQALIELSQLLPSSVYEKEL